MKEQGLTNKGYVVVIGLVIVLLLLLVLAPHACSRDLPDRTQTDTSTTPVVASSSPSSTVTVTATVDKTLPPDTANLTLSIPTIPTKPAESEEGQASGYTPDDVIDMLVEQGAQETQIVTNEDGGNTTIAVSNLSVRDAALAQREAKMMGANVTSIEYDVSDPSSIRQEAISEAYKKSKDDADLLIATLTNGMQRGEAPVNIAIRPIETVAQNESEVTVRVTIDATYSVE